MGNPAERGKGFFKRLKQIGGKVRSPSRSPATSSRAHDASSLGASTRGEPRNDSPRHSQTDATNPQSQQTSESRESISQENNLRSVHHESTTDDGPAAADRGPSSPANTEATSSERVDREPTTKPVKDGHNAENVTEDNQITVPQIQVSQADQFLSLSCDDMEQPQPSSAETHVQGDLWQQAYNLLTEEEKKGLSALRSSEDTPAGNKGKFDGTMVNDAIKVTRKKQEQCEKEAWRINITGKPGDDIILRDKAAVVIDWLTKAGNIGVGFAPSLVQQVWPCVKGLLQIPVMAVEQMQALLQVASNVARVIARGHVYEEVYDEKSTPAVALEPLRQSLVDLYKGALLLLSQAAILLDQNTLTKTYKAVVNPDVIKTANENFLKLQQDLNLDERVAHAASSKHAFEKLRGDLEDLDEPVVRTDENVRKLLVEIESEKFLEQLDWLSKVPHSGHFTETVEKKLDNTCDWILHHVKFQDWERSNGSALIWLRGSTGTGKTYLTTKVIQHKKDLLDKAGTHDEGLAFFYFKRDDPTSRTALSCLGSLLRQLSRPYSKGECMRKDLSELIYKSRVENHTGPSVGLCKKELTTSVNLFPRTTIIIDALDECEPKEIKDLMRTFGDFMRDSTRPLKIFVSGRPETDFGDAFPDRATVKIGVEDNQKDIAQLVKSRMEERRWDDDQIKQKVIKALLEKSEGMFLWTALQVDRILQIELEDDIEEALRQLPKDLEDTYAAICNRQMDSSLGTKRAAITKRAIMWVMAARKPLESAELLSAVRLNPISFIKTRVYPKQDNGVNFCSIHPLPEFECTYVDGKITEEQLLKFCANLLTVNSTTHCWEFCHASVFEYFECYYFSMTQAHSHVGASSLVLLIDLHQSVKLQQSTGATNCLWMGGVDDKNGLSWKNYPSRSFTPDIPEFVTYCSDYWRRHLNSVDKSLYPGFAGPGKPRERDVDVIVPVESLGNLLRSFLGHPADGSPEYKSWARTVISGYHQRSICVLKTMVDFHLVNLLRDWWESFRFQHEGEIYTTDDRTQLVLYLTADDNTRLIDSACQDGNVGMLKMLLDAGINLNKADEARYFSFVCTGENVEMAIFLLEAGMSPRGGKGAWRCPLSVAAFKGNIEMCKLLIETGQCDLDSPTDTDDNPMCMAIVKNKLDILRYLISAGARTNISLTPDSDEPANPGSPLAYAASRGRVDAMRIIVEKGRADPNMILPSRDTAAICAAYYRKFKALEYLVHDLKVDPNAYMADGVFGSVLIAALHGTEVRPETLHSLAALGVDLRGSYRLKRTFESQHDDIFFDCGSALEVVARAGNVVSVKCLIEEYKADVNQRSSSGRYGSALIAAICRDDNGEVVHYLLEAGADVNLQVPQGDYHSPLDAAIKSSSDNLHTVRGLINRGANVNMELTYGQFRSAMMLAASMGRKDLVQLLIDNGADVHRPENSSWSELLQSRQEDTVSDEEFYDSDQSYDGVDDGALSANGASTQDMSHYDADPILGEADADRDQHDEESGQDIDAY